MPNVGQGKQGIDLSSFRKAKEAKAGAKGASAKEKKEQAATQRSRATHTTGSTGGGSGNLMSDDDDDDEDEIIQESLRQDGEKKGLSPMYFAAIPVVVIGAVALFLFLRGGSKAPLTAESAPPTVSETASSTPTQEPEVSLPVGTQDFTGDTNMTSTTSPEDGDNFLQDINGLTTQVNYTVDRIYDAADFVSYTKHRGTWNAGLELYWLEATYKEKKYVIQVPFKYYKELDDVGIVPVKMEVLSIKSEIDGSQLTVVSYMNLDETVLKQILKTQNKGK